MIKAVLSFAIALCGLAIPAMAEEDALMVHDAWAKVSFKNGAVYMNIHNGDTKAAKLLKASSPIAKRVEVHEVTETDGVFKMQQINGLEIPAGEMVVLKPNGYHIMVFGLQKMLKVGDELPLTLHFEGDIQKQLAVEVKPIDHKATHKHAHDHDHETPNNHQGHGH